MCSVGLACYLGIIKGNVLNLSGVGGAEAFYNRKVSIIEYICDSDYNSHVLPSLSFCGCEMMAGGGWSIPLSVMKL